MQSNHNSTTVKNNSSGQSIQIQSQTNHHLQPIKDESSEIGVLSTSDSSDSSDSDSNSSDSDSDSDDEPGTVYCLRIHSVTL